MWLLKNVKHVCMNSCKIMYKLGYYSVPRPFLPCEGAATPDYIYMQQACGSYIGPRLRTI